MVLELNESVSASLRGHDLCPEFHSNNECKSDDELIILHKKTSENGMKTAK